MHCTKTSYDGSDGVLEVVISEERSSSGSDYELFVIECPQIPEFSTLALPICLTLLMIAIVRKKRYFLLGNQEVIE